MLDGDPFICVGRDRHRGKRDRPIAGLRPSPSWPDSAEHVAQILVHNLGEGLCRCECDVLLSRFNEGDVLLDEAGAFRELSLSHA